jgi:putative colanic acid biosynthesis glycosyltransferase
MKILQVNVVYRKGSTGKIVYDIHRELIEQGMKSIVCFGRGIKRNEPNIYKISSEMLAKFNVLRARITGLQYNGSLISTLRLINIIKREKPDVVHLHCINGNFVNIYKLFAFLKKTNIRTVLTLHAEFMHTGSCGHAFECNKWLTGCGSCPQLKEATGSYLLDRTHIAWLKMKDSFNGFDNLRIVAVSKWLGERAKRSPIMNGHNFSVIWNGIDTRDTFHPCNFEFLKEKHGLKDEMILLHVTANFSMDKDDVKGGRYIVELASRLKDDNVKIIVVGSRDLVMSLPDNIINAGNITDQKELAAYYSMADLTVITSKRETFSMVCAESLACGTPVIGFKAGAPEEIALPKYSEFVDFGDVSELVNITYKWIKRKGMGFRPDSEAIFNYSKNKMCSDYQKIYTT